MSDDKANDPTNSSEPVTIEATAEQATTEAEVEAKPEPTWAQRLLSADHWLRFAFMVLFAIILGVVSYVMTALVIVQFIWALIAGEGNDKLREFGSSLSQYIYQMLRFLTYNTEDKPFPFADWPDAEAAE